MQTMISACATHPGLVRQNNEDSIKTDDMLGIYLLADGIGGHNAGEVASALAVDTVYALLRSNIRHTAPDGYFELMVYALHAAHWEIATKAQTNTAMVRMGTTLVVVAVQDNTAYIVNAGDSRCYLLQHNFYDCPDPLLERGSHKFTRLTHDHTVGDQLLADGIPRDEINPKQFHTLTRSLGCGDPPYPDFNVTEISQGDLLLICSDGLTDMLTDSEIVSVLTSASSDLDALAADLVAAANAKGGRDNISVVLVAKPPVLND